jgi:hypothetical protein
MALPVGTATAFYFALLIVAATPWTQAVRADTPAPGEAWRSSPFHGVPNAATGRNIPCFCVYRGKEYRLGDAVCMHTHLGTVVTRCDLSLNNTTWAPTPEPCTISLRQPLFAPRFACAPSAPLSRSPV